MCGIVGAIAQRDVTAILVEGLRRLEYRGYDSTGLALAQPGGDLALWRTVGKVARLRHDRHGEVLLDQPGDGFGLDRVEAEARAETPGNAGAGIRSSVRRLA